MMIYMKGSVLKECIGKPNTTLWNMDTSGHATFIFALSEELLSSFQIGGAYDFACKREDDILFLCVKPEGCDWVSAPYSPHLSKYTHKLYEDEEGKALSILIVNNEDGAIQEMDFLALGTDFSYFIEQNAQDISKNSFDLAEYQNSINQVYQKYATDEELANSSSIWYSID